MNPVYNRINQVNMEIGENIHFPSCSVLVYFYETPFISLRTKRTQDVSFVPEGPSYQARL